MPVTETLGRIGLTDPGYGLSNPALDYVSARRNAIRQDEAAAAASADQARIDGIVKRVSIKRASREKRTTRLLVGATATLLVVGAKYGLLREPEQITPRGPVVTAPESYRSQAPPVIPPAPARR